MSAWSVLLMPALFVLAVLLMIAWFLWLNWTLTLFEERE
jgi:hypothetical protein